MLANHPISTNDQNLVLPYHSKDKSIQMENHYLVHFRWAKKHTFLLPLVELTRQSTCGIHHIHCDEKPQS